MEKKEEVKTEVVKLENISEKVLNRVTALQEESILVLPANYAVGNALKSAWLVLQELKDKDGNPALNVCSGDSVANAMLDMVIQGLSVSKKQGYFIPYGNTLTFQRSYFGTIALAKRCGAITEEPVANVIYEGDDFVYEIDPATGRRRIVKHSQSIQNINNAKIVGAYAISQLGSGVTEVTLMTMEQIRKSWAQGKGGGNSKAHQNFPDEMAKKTVIGRACKLAINSSSDAWLIENRPDEEDEDTNVVGRDAEISNGQAVIELQEGVDVEEVRTEGAKPESRTTAKKADNKPTEAKKEATTDANPY